MMKRNTYRYKVMRNEKLNIDLHVIQIHTDTMIGFHAFNNKVDAMDFVNKMQARQITPIEHDSKIRFFNNCKNALVNADALQTCMERKQIFTA